MEAKRFYFQVVLENHPHMKLWWNEAMCLIGLPNTLLNIVALHNLSSNRQLLGNMASLAVIRLLTSLIPRLPAPECEHWSSVGGESLAHVSTVKGHVERGYKALIVRGHAWRLRKGKRNEGSRQLTTCI